MTTILKSTEVLENQVKAGNYNVTYSDIEKVFTRIKDKGILNELIILDEQARYKNDFDSVQGNYKID